MKNCKGSIFITKAENPKKSLGRDEASFVASTIMLHTRNRREQIQLADEFAARNGMARITRCMQCPAYPHGDKFNPENSEICAPIAGIARDGTALVKPKTSRNKP